ncbi:MAG: site-specific tyrosine recombinase XerD [Bacteroidales bacterium]|jgi:integrase/recombinase XerD|nr:site-specific tyrosine recombinase XerD [Bacteroidales bacterium]
MKQWEHSIRDFENYLKLEKSLSRNSIEAYSHDIKKLLSFLEMHELDALPQNITTELIRDFLYWLNMMGIGERSQARIISGIKSFFSYLWIESIISNDPTDLIETPRIGKKLPEVLSLEEIDLLIGSIDLSTAEGQRNKAIIETLYSCGLRVSELTNLKLSNLYFSEGFIRIIGKGNKERLVPISAKAQQEIRYYKEETRNHMTPKKGSEDIVFLNRRGAILTRVMIFTIIKRLAEKAGITKNISPHTFRHSFATHMVDGGADLRSIQDMLGHESITTTEIYTHLDKEHLYNTIMMYHPRSHKK